MKAVDAHLLTLLKASSQFIVPIYQRLYSWQEAECQQLWADVLRAGSNGQLGTLHRIDRLRRPGAGDEHLRRA